MKLILSLAFLMTSMSLADSASQTDWSGGPGTPGPVSVWGSDFGSDSGMNCFSSPGEAALHCGSIDPVEHLITSFYDFPYSVFPSDIDGDGDVDLLTTSWSDQVTFWENHDGSGTSWVSHQIDGSIDAPVCVVAGDIDGDGDMDAAAAGWSYGEIVWYENMNGLGTSWTKKTIDQASGQITNISMAIADFDGDGSFDVVASSDWTDQVYVWLNTGGLGETWEEHLVEDELLGVSSVSVADIDGDGSIDVQAGGANPGRVCWYENQGGSGAVWVEHQIDNNFYECEGLAAGDIDNDGDQDLFGASLLTSDLTWWENLGSGSSWTEHVVDPNFLGGRAVWLADMDDDQDLDLLAASSHNTTLTGKICWWQNLDGRGTATQIHSISDTFGRVYCVTAADLDGDACAEAAAGSITTDHLATWDASGPSDNGWLESSILYLDCDPEWGSITWTAETPPGASLAFQVRASDDFTQMGTWSSSLTAPCSLDGVLADDLSYLQYRALIAAAEPSAGPVLEDVTISWNTLGTGGGNPPDLFEMHLASQNPVRGEAAVEFGLPEAGMVDLSVFDVAGRLMTRSVPTEYQAGWHSAVLGQYRPGVYFVRARAGESEAVERFVVVE